MRSITAVFSLAILAACTSGPDIRPQPEQVPVEVLMPVATGCIAETGRPPLPDPLNAKINEDEWTAMPAGSKSEAVLAQAGRHMNYEDEERAATSTCK